MACFFTRLTQNSIFLIQCPALQNVSSCVADEGNMRMIYYEYNHPSLSFATLCSSSSERQWLEERVELSSRWSWLQLRLSELDGRIQQLVELHRNICSTKVWLMFYQQGLHLKATHINKKLLFCIQGGTKHSLPFY